MPAALSQNEFYPSLAVFEISELFVNLAVSCLLYCSVVISRLVLLLFISLCLLCLLLRISLQFSSQAGLFTGLFAFGRCNVLFCCSPLRHAVFTVQTFNKQPPSAKQTSFEPNSTKCVSFRAASSWGLGGRCAECGLPSSGGLGEQPRPHQCHKTPKPKRSGLKKPDPEGPAKTPRPQITTNPCTERPIQKPWAAPIKRLRNSARHGKHIDCALGPSFLGHPKFCMGCAAALCATLKFCHRRNAIWTSAEMD